MNLIDDFLFGKGNKVYSHLSSQMLATEVESMKTADRVKRLAEISGSTNLLILVALKALIDKGVLTRDEIQKYFDQLDQLDGAADGKLSLEQACAALGVKAPAPLDKETKAVDRGRAKGRLVRRAP